MMRKPQSELDLPHPISGSRFRRWIDRFVICLLVLVCYGACLFATYGYTDDFWLFFTTDNVQQTYLQAARPVAALTWTLSSKLVDELGDLRYLRLVGILGIALIAVILFEESLRVFPSRIYGMAVAVGVVFLPGMTVFANWATCWIYPWMIVVTWLGAKSIEYANVHMQKQRWKATAAGILGGALLLGAFGTYQPTITWFWLLVLFRFLSPRFWTSRRFRLRIARQFVWGVALFGFCLLAIKVYFLMTGWVPQDRAGLLAHPLPKLQALVRIQIPLCLNLWQVIDVNRKWLVLGIMVVSGLIVIAGIGVRIKRRSTSSHHRCVMWWLLGLIAVLILSHIHWLAIDQNPKNYRTAMTLASCIAMLFFFSLHHLVRQIQPRAVTAVAVLLIVVASFKAWTNSTHYWTRPYARAHSFLVDQLRESIDPGVEKVYMIRQSSDDGIVRERNIYSFGKPYTDFLDDDVVHFEGILNAALIDASFPELVNKLSVSHSLQPPRHVDQRWIVIDFRELKKSD